MEHDYKKVFIYVDLVGNLIIIPTGKSKRFGGATMALDIINVLNKPYTDEQLSEILEHTLKQCFTQTPKDSTSESPLERYLNVKGYSKAVKNRRLIIWGWDCDDGYYILPTEKVPKRGFVHMEDKKISIGLEFDKVKLTKYFRELL